jgi:hypothetical protein
VGTHLNPLQDRAGSKYSADQYQYMARNDFDTGRVYFTTDLQHARAWCTRDADGAVFRVEPVGAYEPDPDFPGTSFSASEAVVVEIVENPVAMSTLDARKAFAAYEPDSYDKRGFIRPEVRLHEMFLASGRDGLAFRREGGRYPNPQRFSFRNGRLRYLTDDNELLLAIKIAEAGIAATDAELKAELAHARSLPYAKHPVRWL